MELPHIGEQCSEPACRQLDFLPFTCPLCKKVFCLQHQKLESHCCPHAASQDVRVPVCPLCNKAVPAPRGQAPDIAISAHLDNNCEVKKERIYKNKCSYRGCRQKELMPIQCRDCYLNYCIPHRHPIDHQCTKVAPRRDGPLPPSSNGGLLQSFRDQAAARLGLYTTSTTTTSSNSNTTVSSRNTSVHHNSSSRNQPQPPLRTGTTQPMRATVNQLQGGMSEDEALALALSQSQDATSSSSSNDRPMRPSNPPTSTRQEDEDAMLQQAIAASLRETRATGAATHKSSDCNVL